MAKKASEGDKRLGNQFWKLRSRHGRDKLFKTPELLWEAACEYFKWCDENPLMETKPFHAVGIITEAKIPHLRAYTIEGLLLYIHASSSYLRQFKMAAKEGNVVNGEDFLTVINQIEKTIYDQQFSGASANMLNPLIIARNLGLSDKKDLTSSDGTMTPRPSVVVNDKGTAKEITKLIDKLDEDEK